jgi:photosystem II stability/assembly factor-like uncharacterized protein
VRKWLATTAVTALLLLPGCTSVAPPDTPPHSPPPVGGDKPVEPPPANPGGAGAVQVIQARVEAQDGQPGDITAAAVSGPDHVWLARGDTLLQSTDGGKTWGESRLPAPVRALDFISPTAGWAVGAGQLLMTTDGGQTWQPVADQEQIDLESVDFVDATHAWGSLGARLLYSANGGQTWRDAGNPCPADRFDMAYSFISPAEGWVLCGDEPGAGTQAKHLLHTTDGGKTWTIIAEALHIEGVRGTLPLGSYLSGLHFRDPQHGWLSETRGQLWATTDGGRTWTPVTIVPNQEQFLRRPLPVTAATGYVLSSQGGKMVMLATRDGGQTWAEVSPPAPAMPLATLDKDRLFAAGTVLDPGAVLRSTDGGRRWEQVGLIPGESVMSLSFVDASHGWAVTDHTDAAQGFARSLWRTADGGETWTRLQTAPPDNKEQYTQVVFVDRQTGYLATGWGHLYVTHDGGATFAPVDTTDSRSVSYDFVDPKTGWKVQDFTIQTTSDGGATWTPLALNYRVWQVDLLPGGHAWVVAGDCQGECKPTLLSTADGGQTWTRYDLGALAPAEVRFADAQHGWLQAGTDRLFTTKDGGQTWTEAR